MTIEDRIRPIFDYCPKLFLSREKAIEWGEMNKDDYKIKIYEYVIGDVCETEVNTVEFDDSPTLSFLDL